MKDELQECLDKGSGQIYVNEYMQVCNQNPLTKEIGGSKTTTFNNVFSLGDVCLTRADEEKTIPPLYVLAPILANNLVNLAKDQPEQLMKVPKMLTRFTVVTIGSQQSIVNINGFVMPIKSAGAKMK